MNPPLYVDIPPEGGRPARRLRFGGMQHPFHAEGPDAEGNLYWVAADSVEDYAAAARRLMQDGALVYFQTKDLAARSNSHANPGLAKLYRLMNDCEGRSYVAPLALDAVLTPNLIHDLNTLLLALHAETPSQKDKAA